MAAVFNIGDPHERRLQILYIQPGTRTFAGIERVIDTICTKLSERYHDQFEVDVLYTSIHADRPVEARKYRVIERVSSSRIKLMSNLRDVIASKNYDVIVVPQIEPTVICMAACLGLRRKFVVHLHGNPTLERSHLKARLLFFAMKNFFVSKLTAIFGTSMKQLQTFETIFNSRNPIYWVPNPVRDFDLTKKVERAEPTITFVNVGRFCFQKGQDILLTSFADLIRKRKDVRLKIVGHGDEEGLLRAKIGELGLESCVSIEHHPVNPQPALASSDIYVSTSRWEGWSLAICEALRFGLPVVATDCNFGPSEILTDERLGKLVPAEDTEALVRTMLYYCDNLEAEKAHSEFRRRYIDIYGSDSVVKVHAEALRSVAAR